MPNNLGFAIETDFDVRADAFLFGEAQSRVVVSVSEDHLDGFLDLVNKSDVEWANLGTVTEGELTIDEQSFGDVSKAKELYDNAIGKMMSN
jgi:phosphoribosylformylglycinamidine synthase